ncbi:MAG: glycosyltransferase family 39 protein [Candidatus Gastranaerophilales bacterium]|nr:glycosyltransferase family 39 protein [Candidatus Gastranaerophilales bacterium]
MKNLKISKYFYIVLLLLIIGLGFYLRITNLNKFALIDDETYCYYLAKQAFPIGILETIFNEDIHAPLYFFILHFWMKFFGENDIMLRFLSVIFGVLNIPVGYLIGKELLSKKTGLLIAAFISFNSLLIYYSQEVKFYSLLPLVISFSLLFLLKIMIGEEKKLIYNYIGLTVSNLALLYTYTFGFIFVFFQTLFFILYLYLKKKEFKSFVYIQLITFVLFLPYLAVFIPHQINNYSKNFFDTISWWSGSFDFEHILILIPNMFSSALIAMTGNIPNYFQILSTRIFDPIYFIFVLIPIIVYFIGIIKGIIDKNAFITLTFLTGLFFIGVEVILILAGKFGIFARYTIIPLITFIITACYGLSVMKNKLLKKTLIVFFIVINLFYLFAVPNSAQRLPRNGKGKVIANLFNKYNISSNSIVILPPYGRSVNKYLSNKINNPLYFDILRLHCIEVLLGEKLTTKLNGDNSYGIFKDYAAYSEPSEAMEKYVKNNIVKKLDKSQFFIIVKDKDIAFFNRKEIEYQLYENPYAYFPSKSKSMYFMLYSKALNDFIIVGNKYLKLINVKKSGLFEIYIFKKI